MTHPARSPLHLVALSMSVGFSAIAATSPVVQRLHGASDADVALAGMYTSVATVAGALWAGRRPATIDVLARSQAVLALAAVALVAVALGGHGFHPAWRALDGVALGIALVMCETLLLRSSTAALRAAWVARYTLATAAGWVLGPLLSAALTSVSVYAGFCVAFVAGVVAAAVALMARRDVPAERAVVESVASPEPATTVWRRNVTACMTTLHFGAFQSALLVVLPLRVLHEGNSGQVAMLVMASFALGMLLFSRPNTARGERDGPVRVMAVVCVVGGAAVLATGLVPLQGPLAMTLAFTIGATLATLSPLSLLLLLRHNDGASLGAANAFYNAHYAVGLAIGPTAVAGLVGVCSMDTLLVAMGALWVLHALFIALTAPVPLSPGVHP